MDSLEEDLSCSVCYGLFSDPRVLPCSHTFCRSCLDNVLQLSSNISIWRPLRLPLKCPNCRSVVELPPSGVDALPANVSLRAIIEKFQKDHHQPRAPCCADHPGQPLNVYCVQDRRLVCGLCLTVGKHQGHAIDDLQAAFIRERQAPAGLLARLADQRWAQVCELGDQLQKEKQDCEAMVRQDGQVVEQFFQGLELILAQKREAFLGALDSASLEISLTFDPLIHRLKEMQEEHLDLVSQGSRLQQEESPLSFLQKVHNFRERVEALLISPLPSATPLSIAPRAADFLPQHWATVTVGDLEGGPVPQVSCCTPPEAPELGSGAEASCPSQGRVCEIRERLQPRLAPLVLLVLLVLLGAVWGDLGALASSLLSLLNHTAQRLGWGLGGWGWGLGEVVGMWGEALSTLGKNSYQQLTSFYKNLT
ncbi:tripartite motif-containing protein 59 [Osmerus eperlanus]|uniref:tripartite motif-containing protein 59 n=1 Tax=Osmerus eperlanus TaxID=29151 RepID=UPI002E133868